VIYIVGSGPAGVACAHALVSRDIPVTLLDAGIEMEPDLRQVLTTMVRRRRRRGTPPTWNGSSAQPNQRPRHTAQSRVRFAVSVPACGEASVV
jgi:2-polyprenyl-6-methoxyphenol hydroxylase-like FAD-dependent oxidoreductase